MSTQLKCRICAELIEKYDPVFKKDELIIKAYFDNTQLPMIFHVNGEITSDMFLEVEKDLRETDFGFDMSGSGPSYEIEFEVTYFDGQYGVEGRCEAPQCFEFKELSRKEVA